MGRADAGGAKRAVTTWVAVAVIFLVEAWLSVVSWWVLLIVAFVFVMVAEVIFELIRGQDEHPGYRDD